jgi:hypothetical protein
MKIRYAVLLAMLVVFAAVPDHKAIAGGGDGGSDRIPLPTGQFSLTDQGSVALCLDPTNNFTPESCSISGALVVPSTVLDNGAGTYDSAGNSCFTFTETVSNLPVDASPPLVVVIHVTTKVVSYDAATGTGDGSITRYSGGTCNGAGFDDTGATKDGTVTYHFVVTDGGNRIDFLITGSSDPATGDFSASGTELRQRRGHD